MFCSRRSSWPGWSCCSGSVRPGPGWSRPADSRSAPAPPSAKIGQILILPAALYLLVAVRGWRLRLRQAAVLCAAFLLPILAYCTTSYLVTGHFRLADQGTNELYGRVVLAADCHAVPLPADERPLCPTGQYASARHRQARCTARDRRCGSFRPPGPGRAHRPSPPISLSACSWQDPAGVIAAIGRDALRLFALTRVTSPGDTPISRWQFQTAYPTYQHVSLQTVRAAGQRFGGGGPAVSRPLAAFLRAYQLDGGYTPGPLLALAALAGLAGSTGVLRRRRPAVTIPGMPPPTRMPSATSRPPACCASPSPLRCCSPRTCSSSAGATSFPRWSRSRRRRARHPGHLRRPGRPAAAAPNRRLPRRHPPAGRAHRASERRRTRGRQRRDEKRALSTTVRRRVATAMIRKDRDRYDANPSCKTRILLGSRTGSRAAISASASGPLRAQRSRSASQPAAQLAGLQPGVGLFGLSARGVS